MVELFIGGNVTSFSPRSFNRFIEATKVDKLFANIRLPVEQDGQKKKLTGKSTTT
jgi:Leucine-rich repeat (LRR) protein